MLVTERLELRKQTASEIDARIEDEARRRRVRAQHDAGTAIGWSLLLRGDVIGIAGIHHIAGTTAQVGYELDVEHTGKGLMSEAMTRILEHALGDLGFERLEAHIDLDNARSIRLAERLGFVHEADDVWVLRRAG